MMTDNSPLPRARLDRPFMGWISHGFKAVFFLAVAVVTFESLIPPQSVSIGSYNDKIIHFGAYFVLSILGGIAYPKANIFALLWPLIFLGAGIEVAQHLMGQGRSGSIGDLIANTLGTIAPALFWALYVRQRDSRAKV